MRLLLFVVLITLASMGNLVAQEGADQSRDVEVKIYLIDIDGIDNVEQSFVANLTLVMRWHDPGLAHPGLDSVEKSLKDIWYPRLQILNQQRLVKTFPESVEVRPDGQVIYRQRLWGGFSQPLNLREFPFDKQRLEILVGNISFGSQKIRLTASPDSGISDYLTIPDWKILQWDFAARELRFDNETTLSDDVLARVLDRRQPDRFPDQCGGDGDADHDCLPFRPGGHDSQVAIPHYPGLFCYCLDHHGVSCHDRSRLHNVPGYQ
jgi:hypothetical protein